MGVFPLAAGIVATVFTGALARTWFARRRPSQLLWTIAMAMYAAASFALFAGAAFGWSSLIFRTYWLFGAVLTVPFLAGGEALLLSRSRGVALGVAVLLGILVVVGLVVVFGATVDAEALAARLPRGAEAFAATPIALMLARVYAYLAYAFLLGGALWSAAKMRGAPELRNRFYGTLLIALGATVVAGGSAFAAMGIMIGFSLTLLVGITLMFLGFLRASVPSVALAPA